MARTDTIVNEKDLSQARDELESQSRTRKQRPLWIQISKGLMLFVALWSYAFLTYQSIAYLTGTNTCTAPQSNTVFILPADSLVSESLAPVLASNGEDHRSPRERHPDVSKWVRWDGETQYDSTPEEARGITFKGTKSFGKIVFETSKISDKVRVQFDLRTRKRLENQDDIRIENKDGQLEVQMSDDLEAYASATIQIPSNIVGTFVIPHYEIDAPHHMLDFSSLPESLEIEEWLVRLAKGFIKTGQVHSRKTSLVVGKGAIRGSIRSPSDNLDINVADGNVRLDVSGTSGGHESRSRIRLGNGDLNGTFSVYRELTLDVVKGNIWADVKFDAINDLSDGEEMPVAELSTKTANGNSRVYVDNELGDRIVDASHTTVSGRQLITYPHDFEGTVDVRSLVGKIVLEGDGLEVERSLFGVTGKKGDSERNKVKIRAAKGDVDVLVGDDDE
ncbi:hypothetical protein PYCC9005_002218 [Savitreella phatthalungensis]